LPGEKILIVDDEKNIATLIELHLEMEGYKTSIAYDGATAFERLSEYTPDLIILDIMMPRMDGWELCRELKGNRKFSDIPVIMLTAKSHKDDIKKGWNLGVADYITKPFSPVRLVEVIKRVLLSKKEAGISLKETRRPDYPDGVNIGVLGSSEAGISIIQFLLGDSRVNIRGVAGIDPDSPVMHLAKKLDIFSTTDIREFLAIKDLQIVFILSENEELKGILEKEKPAGIEFVRGDAASFIWYLIEQRCELEEKERSLVKELNTRVNELSALNEVAKLITSTLNLNELLEKIIVFIQKLIPLPACCIMIKENSHGLKIKTSLGLSDEYLERLSFNKLFEHYILTRARPFILSDIDMEFYEFVSPEGFGSILCSPLCIKDSLTGLIINYGEEGYVFSQADMNILSTVASDLSIAIENASLYNSLEKKLNEAEILYEASRIMAASIDMNSTLQSIIETMVKAVKGDSGLIILLDEETDEWIPCGSFNFSLDKLQKKEPLNLGQGVARLALKKKQAIAIFDVSQEKSRFVLSEIPDVVSTMVLPLFIKDKAFGVAYVNHKTHKNYSLDEIHLLTTLAGQASVSLENARLYETVKQKHQAVERLLTRLIDSSDSSRNEFMAKLQKQISLSVTETVKQLEICHSFLFSELNQLRTRIDEMKHISMESLERIHGISDITGTSVDSFELLPNLETCLQHFEAESGINTELIVSGVTRKMGESVETTIYHIIQEALRNVRDHSKALNVRVRIKVLSDQFNVAIEDDGVGFEQAKIMVSLDPATQRGLTSIKEKASFLGGTFKIRSYPGRGTVVLLRLPIPSS